MERFYTFKKKSMEFKIERNTHNCNRETVIPDEEMLMAIKREPQVIFEEDGGPCNFSTLKLIMGDFQLEIDNLKKKVDSVISQQKHITDILAENNVLLRKNLGLFEVTQTLFPVDSEEKLGNLEKDLSTEKQDEIMVGIRRIMRGNIKNIERVIAKELLIIHNLDGTKEKKSFKSYGNVLNAIYESTKKKGYAYEDFKKELRLTFRRVKNSYNRDKMRKRAKRK